MNFNTSHKNRKNEKKTCKKETEHLDTTVRHHEPSLNLPKLKSFEYNIFWKWLFALLSRSRFEGLSLHDDTFLFSQGTFFLSLQQFSLLLQQHTQAFCLPALNIPSSGGMYGVPETLLRLHLIRTQNQLKNWNKLHKLPIIWTKQTQLAAEALTKDPTNQILIKRQDQLSPFFLALFILCKWIWIGIMPGSQLQFTYTWLPTCFRSWFTSRPGGQKKLAAMLSDHRAWRQPVCRFPLLMQGLFV